MKTSRGLNRYLIQFLGFFGGVIILSSLSIIQKKIIGAPISIKGFIVPFSFGGTVGYLLGYYISKLYQTINKLKKSEKRCRAIFEGSYDGIVFSNSIGNIVLGNRSISNMLGYSQGELCNMRIEDILPLNSEEREKLQTLYKKLEADGESEYLELEIITKDKNLLPVEISLHKLKLEENTFNWAVIRDVSERKRLEQKIFETMVGAEEKERERYAKEFHDILGPLLSTAIIYMHSIQPKDEPEKIIKFRNRVIDLLEETIQNIRSISNNLSHEALSRYGLEAAIGSFTERLKPVTGIKFNISSDLEKRLPETTEFTLYRTLIELVNNTIKHAHATHVAIAFQQINGKLRILYNDDGQGFEYEKKKKEHIGFGLANLESRIRKIGGYYNYFSKPGGGVKVEIKLLSQD